MIIYKITNKINNKIYIGQTIRTLNKRWVDHCKNKKSSTVLHLAIKKYGKINFTIETIDRANTLEELNNKEQLWIKKLNCIAPNGYNLCFGGNNSGKQSEILKLKRKNLYNENPELRRIIGEASKKNWQDLEYKNKLSRARKDMWKNLEFRKKQLERLKKLTNTNDFIEKRNKALEISHINRRKKITCYKKDGTPLMSFYSIAEAVKKFNFTQSSISNCCKYKHKTHKDFFWRFAEEVF